MAHITRMKRFSDTHETLPHLHISSILDSPSVAFVHLHFSVLVNLWLLRLFGGWRGR